MPPSKSSPTPATTAAPPSPPAPAKTALPSSPPADAKTQRRKDAKTQSASPGDGTIPDSDFTYDQQNDHYHCPQGKPLARKSDKKGKASQSTYRVYHSVESCKDCPLLGKCTTGKYRKFLISHDQEAITANAQRLHENPEKPKQRGSIVEHPFGTLKDRLGRDHLVCRGLALVGAEISLAALAYNLSRAIKILGVPRHLQEIQDWNPATPGPNSEKNPQAAQKAA